MKSHWRNTLGIVLIVIGAPALSSCIGPRLEVLSEQLKETSVKTSGEDDYAISYHVRVRNKGLGGKVRAIAQLFHPEGTFFREEIVSFKPGEDADLEFIFTEPTVVGTLVAGADGQTRSRAVFRYELTR
jgi:hypothetical protein